MASSLLASLLGGEVIGYHRNDAKIPCLQSQFKAVITSVLRYLNLLSTIFQRDLEGYSVDPTAYFHDSTDDALQNEVVVPPTRCPLDADSFTIFQASMSEVQGEDPWDMYQLGLLNSIVS